MTHHVHQQRQGTHTRWVCEDCTWSTPWTVYTDAVAGAAAVRHSIEGEPS